MLNESTWEEKWQEKQRNSSRNKDHQRMLWQRASGGSSMKLGYGPSEGEKEKLIFKRVSKAEKQPAIEGAGAERPDRSSYVDVLRQGLVWRGGGTESFLGEHTGALLLSVDSPTWRFTFTGHLMSREQLDI